jgi:hypothetical protein
MKGTTTETKYLVRDLIEDRQHIPEMPGGENWIEHIALLPMMFPLILQYHKQLSGKMRSRMLTQCAEETHPEHHPRGSANGTKKMLDLDMGN